MFFEVFVLLVVLELKLFGAISFCRGLEKVQGATRIGATELRASEREICL